MNDQGPIKEKGASNLAYIRGLHFVIAGETAIPYVWDVTKCLEITGALCTCM